jgi:hypothetical protein
VDKKNFLQKLEALLDEALRLKTFGHIEVELRAGHPVLLRKTVTERLEERGTPHACEFSRQP